MRPGWIRRVWALITPYIPGDTSSVASTSLRLYTHKEDATDDLVPGSWVGEYHLLEPILDEAGRDVPGAALYEKTQHHIRTVLLKRAHQVEQPEQRRAYLDAALAVGQCSPFKFDIRTGKVQTGDVDLRYAEVLFDGRRLRDCVAADPDRGEVLVYRRDPEGHIVSNSAGVPLYDLRRGDVVVRTPTAQA